MPPAAKRDPAIPDANPQTATPFGKYLLVKRLALGGMAELFLAQDTETDKLLVIKRILPYLSEEPEFVQMFLDEARIASQLHHPNVIEVYELGLLQDSIFIAMEYVEGYDVRYLLQEETKLGLAMPYGVVAYIAAKVCSGLHSAHNSLGMNGLPLGLIHRDISPQNVMVSFDGRVKLVDFGIAKASAFMERSKPGVIKGKFLYLAPEQLTNERLDHRADLFALGSMMYELTTGKAPFYKQTTEAVIYAIRAEQAQPPSLLRSDYPPELARIVLKCLEKDRTRRYQQAGEIEEDLEAFLARYHPTDAAVLSSYADRLFGSVEERTVLHLPPSSRHPKAQTSEALRALGGAKNPPTPSARKQLSPGRSRALPALEAPIPEPGAQRYQDELATVDRPDGGMAPLPVRRKTGARYLSAGGSDFEPTVTGKTTTERPEFTPTAEGKAPRGPQLTTVPGHPGFELPPDPLFDEPSDPLLDEPSVTLATGAAVPRARRAQTAESQSTASYDSERRPRAGARPARPPPHPWLLAAAAFAVVLGLGGMVLWAWPEPSDPLPPPARSQTVEEGPPAPAPSAPPPGRPEPSRPGGTTRVAVLFTAPAGTTILVDGERVDPGETRSFFPGSLGYQYQCPGDRSPSINGAAELQRTDETLEIALSCQSNH